MGIGIVMSILTTVCAALVEEQRKHLAITRPTIGFSAEGGAISSMAWMWLIPQQLLTGLTEAFNSIDQIEFYYMQFPKNIRSIANAVFFLGIAIANFLYGLMISVVHHVTDGSRGGDWLAEDLNKGKLDNFYLIATSGVVYLIYFSIRASWYRHKGIGPSTSELAM